ncbi:MAG: argininosuccinate synthase [Phycisphaeraceae bacterium]|nr:argininosuccinate synthase [Phycisphaeraceae bacterium]
MTTSSNHPPRKICVAYSGGLDTSCIIPWLKERWPGCEVIAVVADVGQGAAELEGVEAKALRTGASHCEVVDLRREFLESFVFPMVVTGAVYEGRYLLGTSIARPIIARAQVDAARAHGADAVAHGCTGKGNDQVRFESTYAALAPELRVIAPWRLWELRSREQMLAYLQERNIPTTASATKIYSRDANLWHISHEGGALENPWNPPPEDIWTRTANPEKAPDRADEVIVSFRSGMPVAVDGRTLDPVALLTRLNELGAPHGVGRVDLIENRLVGMKSRGCYETPGGTILMEALRGLEELVLDRKTLHHRERLALDFAELVYNGEWFTPLRAALWAAAETIARPLTGDVAVRLFKGRAVTVRRRSPNALYHEAFATFGADEVYDQTHAEGFIRLFALPSRIRALSEAERAASTQPGSPPTSPTTASAPAPASPARSANSPARTSAPAR